MTYNGKQCAGNQNPMAATFKQGKLYHSLTLFVKNAVPICGSLMLAIAGKGVDRNEGYEKRVLIIFGGGIGDVVKRTVISGLVEQYLADCEVHYLSPYDLPLPGTTHRHTFKYSKAKTNPFYYFSLVNDLRKTGFSKVIVLLPFWEGFLSFLGVDTGADRVYCDDMVPPDEFMRAVRRFNKLFRGRSVAKKITLIKTENGWDDRWKKDYFPSDAWRELSFVSKAIKCIRPDVAMANRFLLPLASPPVTSLEIDEDREKAYLEGIKQEYALEPGNYCVIGMGSSDSIKNWPTENFASAAMRAASRGLKLVIVGVESDLEGAKVFKEHCAAECVDLVTKALLPKSLFLMKNAALMLCNDTSYAHIAVALRRPLVCVIGRARTGADSDYGYKAIEKWVFPKKPGALVGEVKVEDVAHAIDEVLEARSVMGRDPIASEFEISYFHDDLLEPKTFKR